MFEVRSVCTDQELRDIQALVIKMHKGKMRAAQVLRLLTRSNFCYDQALAGFCDGKMVACLLSQPFQIRWGNSIVQGSFFDFGSSLPLGHDRIYHKVVTKALALRQAAGDVFAMAYGRRSFYSSFGARRIFDREYYLLSVTSAFLQKIMLVRNSVRKACFSDAGFLADCYTKSKSLESFICMERDQAEWEEILKYHFEREGVFIVEDDSRRPCGYFWLKNRERDGVWIEEFFASDHRSGRQAVSFWQRQARARRLKKIYVLVSSHHPSAFFLQQCGAQLCDASMLEVAKKQIDDLLILWDFDKIIRSSLPCLDKRARQAQLFAGCSRYVIHIQGQKPKLVWTERGWTWEVGSETEAIDVSLSPALMTQLLAGYVSSSQLMECREGHQFSDEQRKILKVIFPQLYSQAPSWDWMRPASVRSRLKDPL